MPDHFSPIEAKTCLFSRRDVERLLSPDLAIRAVEEALRRSALGQVAPSGILGMHAEAGGFHVKAGLLDDGDPYFAAKVNANFPHNPSRYGLPTIQGAVLLFHAGHGRLLAIMDSMAITAIRTAAATAIAARHLSRTASEALLVCGCGAQALAQLEAMLCVRAPARVLAYDQDAAKAKSFAARVAQQGLGVVVTPTADLGAALRASDLVVTCTTATTPFVMPELVRPGTFIAAVGADHETKNEIAPALMVQSRVVTDSTPQAARIGDLHHALAAGAMAASDVHAELGEVLAGLRPGRTRDDETFVFDSTGLGLQDVAAAIAVYQRACEEGHGTAMAFG